MDIVKVIKSRYSVKEFDAQRKISPDLMSSIKELLQYAPSSTNVQPWHFIIAESDDAKRRVAKATQGFFRFNEQKVLNASAVIVFSSKVTADDNFMAQILEKEDEDGRFSKPEFKSQTHNGRLAFTEIHRYDLKDEQHWLEKQVYLNLGAFLLGVAALGLDALPMEGIDTKILNIEFDLISKGYTASVVVAVGYRSDDDFNADLPKSRLLQRDIIEVL